jgi:hypothetical protein
MKSRSTKLVMLALLPTCIFWSSCGDDGNLLDATGNISNTDFVATESFTFNVEFKNQLQLRLQGINSGVVITGVAGANSIRITGEKRVGSESTADAREHLQDLEVNVEDMADEVYVKTIQPKDSRGRNYVVNYSITIPQNLKVRVDNTNGKITLNDIFASAYVSQTNGDIEGEVTLPPDGAIDMSLTNGGIELDIPKNTSAEFSASLTNGNISVSNLDLRNRAQTPRSVSGICGDGRGTISLRTTNGSITVAGF